MKGVKIEIKNLSKSFGKNNVLDNINLDIESGEFVSIVGKSGSGKSTLLRQLTGLDDPTSGTTFHNGKAVKGSLDDTKIMFQDDRLLPWLKIIDNVGIGLNKNELEKAKWALEQVGLTDKENDWPSQLSGGQKQRVALARALVSKPKLLLLDEPLGALDALTRLDMQALIENLWLDNGFTAIMVTHDVSEAVALSDRVILIEDGVIGLDKKIPLYRPREKGNAAYAELEGFILNRVLGKTKENEIDFVI